MPSFSQRTPQQGRNIAIRSGASRESVANSAARLTNSGLVVKLQRGVPVVLDGGDNLHSGEMAVQRMQAARQARAQARRS